MTSLWQELMTRLDRKHQVSILYLFLFSLALAVMVNFSWQELPSSVDEGEIATHDIRADNDYEIIDKEATEKSREEVMSGILPVYHWEPDASGLKIIADRSVFTPWLEKGILNVLSPWKRLESWSKKVRCVSNFGSIFSTATRRP